jgi:hypothetical protein
MTGGGCSVACLPVEAFPGHMLDYAAVRSSGRRVLVEGPWACWACSCPAAGVGSATSLVGRPGEACVAVPTPRANQPGHHHRRRSRCQE